MHLSLYSKLLEEFMIIIFKHDPMQLNSRDIAEYDDIALSILTRFVESDIGELKTKEVMQIANEIVDQAFHFWYFPKNTKNEKMKINYTKLINELIEIYKLNSELDIGSEINNSPEKTIKLEESNE